MFIGEINCTIYMFHIVALFTPSVSLGMDILRGSKHERVKYRLFCTALHSHVDDVLIVFGHRPRDGL